MKVFKYIMSIKIRRGGSGIKCFYFFIKDIGSRYTIYICRYMPLQAYLHFSGRKLLTVVSSGQED